MSYPSDRNSPEELDASSQEDMTGWDDPWDLDQHPIESKSSMAARLLVAISNYVATHSQDDLNALNDVMHHMDWDAINFVQNAVDRGEDIFASLPNEDTLIRFKRPIRREPGQLPLEP